MHPMKTFFIILMFVSAFVAFYEQSKPQPNIVVMVIALVVFMGLLMRLMNSVPSRKKGDKEDSDV